MNRQQANDLITRCDELGFEPTERAKVINEILNGAEYSQVQRSIDQVALSGKSTTTKQRQRKTTQQISDQDFLEAIRSADDGLLLD